MPRARKSQALHELAGTLPQWQAGDPPQFTAGTPKMPKDLPEVAKQEWKRITKELKKRGTLTSVDSSALEVYCRLFSQWKAYANEVEENGPMIDEPILDKDGGAHTRRVLNPAGKVAIQLGTAVRMYQKEFSATPASRERTKPAKPSKQDERFAPGTLGWLAQQKGDEEEAEPLPPEVEQENTPAPATELEEEKYDY